MNDSKALMVSLRDRVFEASADALLIGDAEGRILSVNTSFERLFGCDAGTAAGRHFIDFAVDKARLEQCVKPAPNSLECHEIWPSYESAHRRTWLALTVESGDSFLAEVALTFHIEAGTILGFTAAIREVSITERLHRDSDKPQISPGLFQRLFEASPGMLAIAGFDGSFCWVNRSWTKVTGFPSEVLASRPLYTLFHEADHARVGCRFANLVGQESETIEFVARCVCADGRYKWISWSASLDADRGFIYIIANDVTELVATRDQLRRSEELLQQTSRVAKVSGWELEMRTLELRWSEEAYRLYGIPMDAQPTVEEAISFFEPDARPMLRAALDRVATEGTPFDLQLPFRRPSGERMWVRVLGQAELVDGEPIRVRGAFQDVSAEWAGERAKRDFVSIVSHELRTPLSSLYGSLRLLEGGVVGALPSPAKRLVGMARSNSDRLLRLIDDLLDLERIETGNLDYNVSDLDMSQVVWRAVGEVQGMAQEASVELEVREQQIP
ncbi:MAG: PAS domain S-box protein, partial [Myxococcota bacterium]